MLFSELKNTLQNLKKQKITNQYFANLYGTSSQNISKRVNGISEVTVSELELVQADTGILLYISTNDKNFKIIKNSLERRNDNSISKKILDLESRLNKIQNKHEYLDKDMAKLLKITEEDYTKIKSGQKEIDIMFLNRIKQLFEISVDWLLYSE